MSCDGESFMSSPMHTEQIDTAVLDAYLGCPDCDLLHRIHSLPKHRVARCTRCDAPLYRGGEMNIEHLLAWSLTAMLLLIVSNSYPILSLWAAGRSAEVTFYQAVMSFVDKEMWLLAVIVFLTSMAVPLFRICSLLFIMGLAWRGRLRAGRFTWLLRWNTEAAPWGMLEIYLLALLVALVKLRDIAEVVPGLSFYAFFLLIFTLAMTSSLLDPFQLWRLVTDARDKEAR
jgi:paraquat-inducible protein A